jgi:hypothetical protein
MGGGGAGSRRARASWVRAAIYSTVQRLSVQGGWHYARPFEGWEDVKSLWEGW